MSRARHGLRRTQQRRRGRCIVWRLPGRQRAEMNVKIVVLARCEAAEAGGREPIWETTRFVCGLRVKQVPLCGG